MSLLSAIVFVVELLLSMAGLALALRTGPTRTWYAVWVGIGASLTVVYAMVTGAGPVSSIKVLLVLGLIGCIIRLKLVFTAH